MSHPKMPLDQDNAARFDPATGVLSFIRDMSAEMVRIPRSQRLRTTNHGTLYMYFMAGTRIVLEVSFDPATYPDMYEAMSVWWVKGRTGNGTARPEGG